MTTWHIACTPDTAPGAFVGCECSACREARLRDDTITHTVHDILAAYHQGWIDGARAGATRDPSTTSDETDRA